MQASITKYMSIPPKLDLKPNYSSLNLNELKSMCKKREIKGYSRLNKGDLVKLLEKDGTGLADCFEVKQTVKNPNTKRGSKKILTHLVNSRQIVLLQRIKNALSNVILYHPTTNFVFNESSVKKDVSFTVIGYLTQDLNVLPLTKDMIHTCKAWNFDYILPENISYIDPTRELNLEDQELDDLLYKTGMHNEDDELEDEMYPNYNDMY
jgi:hypothetical protein